MLSPTKRNACGTSALNARLQLLLNPPAQDKEELPASGYGQHAQHGQHSSSSSTTQHGAAWRVGDRVVHLVNDPERDVYNGGHVGDNVEQEGRREGHMHTVHVVRGMAAVSSGTYLATPVCAIQHVIQSSMAA